MVTVAGQFKNLENLSTQLYYNTLTNIQPVCKTNYILSFIILQNCLFPFNKKVKTNECLLMKLYRSIEIDTFSSRLYVNGPYYTLRID